MSDIKALARQHAKSWYHEEWEEGSYIHEELVDEFERAILAERERCAKLAEEDLRSPMAKKAGHVPSWLARGRLIAAAIRKGAAT